MTNYVNEIFKQVISCFFTPKFVLRLREGLTFFSCCRHFTHNIEIESVFHFTYVDFILFSLILLFLSLILASLALYPYALSIFISQCMHTRVTYHLLISFLLMVLNLIRCLRLFINYVWNCIFRTLISLPLVIL